MDGANSPRGGDSYTPDDRDTDGDKAKRGLGIEHRPLEEGLREYLVWETEQLGMEGRTTPPMNAADTVQR